VREQPQYLNYWLLTHAGLPGEELTKLVVRLYVNLFINAIRNILTVQCTWGTITKRGKNIYFTYSVNVKALKIYS
jgi:hypothetical protein